MDLGILAGAIVGGVLCYFFGADNDCVTMGAWSLGLGCLGGLILEGLPGKKDESA
jgi:hypothetical protein